MNTVGWSRLLLWLVLQLCLEARAASGVPGAEAARAAPSAAASQLSLALLPTANQARQYEKIEFHIEAPTAYTNAFDPEEVELDVRFTTPGAPPVTVPAFFYQHYERRSQGSPRRQRDWLYPVGMPGWKVRFAPMKTGRYEAVATLRERRGKVSSPPVVFDCVPSHSSGFIRVSQTDPRFFEFTEGQPFFAVGQNLAFIGLQQYVTLSRAEQIFQKLGTNGANYLRLWTCCEDWALAIEARKSAWGRSWNWRPPVTPVPGAEDSGRKCLTLTADHPALKVEPSHPVALIPLTRYSLKGEVRLSHGASLVLTVNNMEAEGTFSPADSAGWQRFEYQFRTDPEGWWLGETSFRLKGESQVWLDELSLRETAGGPELLWEADVNRPVRGYYNPLDCWMLDQIVTAAEKNGIFLQLCLLTRDLYMGSLKDKSSDQYDEAIRAAKKTFRYAVARWGYSTSVAAWEYWNEMDPGLPTDRFYSELGEFLEATDPYHHLRTTSTWGPSPKDCRHPKLDIADAHFYLRPADKDRLEDEVHAVIDRARWLREQAPKRPAHLGEFGLADDKWRITDEMRRSAELADAHSALWASALSGLSGTALFWWWERLDERNFYPHYRPLSQFIADVPWNSGNIQPAAISYADAKVRAMGLQANDRAWVWLYNRESAWSKIVSAGQEPSTLANVTLELRNLPPGDYRLRWFDTREAKVIREETVSLSAGAVRATAPPFARDVACAVGR